MDDDSAAIDLTLLLSCLSRDDLELLLVHAISRHPALYDRLVAQLSRPVDTASLASSLASLLSFTAQPSALTPELEPHVEQAGDYVRCGRVRGGVEVLECVSEAVVGWVKQVRRGRESEVDDEYTNLESFFGLLESAWSEAFDAVVVSDAPVAAAAARRAAPLFPGANSLSVRELKQLANKMTQWQHALTKSMGPLFADPLRSVKRIIKQAEEAGARGEAEVGAEERDEQKEGHATQRLDKRKTTAVDEQAERRVGASDKRVKTESVAFSGQQATKAKTRAPRAAALI